MRDADGPAMSARFLFVAASLSTLALLAPGCFQTSGDDSVTNVNDDAGSDAAPLDAAPGAKDGARDLPDGPDAVEPALVMFAGDGPSIFDDTWQLFTGDDECSQAATSTSAVVPAKRYQHRLASLGSMRVALFGGVYGGTYYDDTWIFDGRDWMKSAASGPSARSDHAMAAFGNDVLLYGGQGQGAQLSDTWIFDGETWTEIDTTADGGTNPGLRIGAAMATLNGKAYLFGGVGADASTWAFDGTSWTKVASTGPSERCFMQMATLDSAIYLFGGEEDANHIQDDTWKFDGTTWTKLNVAGPTARFQYGMDAFRSKIFLFGGDAPVGAANPFLGDTWSFDGTSWSALTTNAGPGGRYPYTLAARRD